MFTQENEAKVSYQQFVLHVCCFTSLDDTIKFIHFYDITN